MLFILKRKYFYKFNPCNIFFKKKYSNNMNAKKITINTIISTSIIVSVAVLGSIFVNIGINWFNTLQKPAQWIPNILIPIVWTIIYSAFGLINFFWIKNNSIPTKTIVLMLINGFLNIFWCLVFFALKLTFLGNIVIILNLIAGFLLLTEIFKINKLYAYILSIYPLWLSIATTLNLALWILN